MEKKSIEVGSKDWKELRRLCRNDLWFFNREVLGHGEVFPMTYKAHYAMCRFAERKTGIKEIDESRVQLIQIWRGAGKTLNITKGRTLQRLCQNQDWAAGIANEKQDNASEFLGMIKAEFEQNELLRALFPELIPPDFRKTEWRSDRIVINRTRPNPVNPSVLAAGVNATVTGVHMNEWIVDDIISQDAAENARTGSFTEIEKANRWVVRLQPLLSRPKSDPITFIGTPWWIDDCYAFVENLFGRGDAGVEYIWRLEMPDGASQVLRLVQRGELAIFRHFPVDEAGRATWPEGDMTLENLEKLRKDDPVFYMAQYMLDPGAGEAADFQLQWLKEYEWESEYQIRFRDSQGKTHFERVKDLHTIISVDPAISKETSADRSAIVVTGTNGKQIFLLDIWVKRVGATELAEKVVELYQHFRPSRVVVETVSYQEALAEILVLLAEQRNVGHRLPIYEHKTGSKIRKEVRILGLEPYFRKGLIYWHPRTQHEFLSEYKGFPHTKHDDILDALSFQKELWERFFSRKDQEQSLVREWRALDQQRAAHVRAAMGRRRRRV